MRLCPARPLVGPRAAASSPCRPPCGGTARGRPSSSGSGIPRSAPRPPGRRFRRSGRRCRPRGPGTCGLLWCPPCVRGCAGLYRLGEGLCGAHGGAVGGIRSQPSSGVSRAVRRACTAAGTWGGARLPGRGNTGRAGGPCCGCSRDMGSLRNKRPHDPGTAGPGEGKSWIGPRFVTPGVFSRPPTRRTYGVRNRIWVRLDPTVRARRTTGDTHPTTTPKSRGNTTPASKRA